jgi:hypothetical protein
MKSTIKEHQSSAASVFGKIAFARPQHPEK